MDYYNQYSPESRDSDILGHSRSVPMYNSAVPDPFLYKQPDGRNVSADIQINSTYSPSFQTERDQGVQMSLAMQ